VLRAVQFGNTRPLDGKPHSGNHGGTTAGVRAVPPLAQRAWLDTARWAAV